VIAFNRLIERGLPRGAPAILTDEILVEIQKRPKRLEKLPSWTERVAPLEQPLIIPDENDKTPAEERRSRHFLRKNIYCVQPHVLFV
jgi:hypothetical protein